MAQKTAPRGKSRRKISQELRGFIELLREKDELIEIRKKTASKFEAAAVQMKVLNTLGKPVLFSNVDGKKRNMVGNLYTSRKMLGYMFGVEPSDLIGEIGSYRTAKRYPVKILDKGPCQEVVHHDFKDIRDIVPIPWNYERDANYYITAGVVLLRHPETGKLNTAICRMMYVGGRQLSIFFAPMQHNWTIFQQYRNLKKDMPVAVILGTDPITMFASESGIAYEEDEFEYAGAMLGRSLEVVPCLNSDLYVPAYSEFVMEGSVSWQSMVMEGPMGENQRVYGKQEENPLLTISCITHRENPVYQNILPGTVEEHSLLALPMEARVLEKLRRVSDRIRSVNLLPNFMNCVIQIDDYPVVQRGVAKNVLLAALAEPWIKYAVIVNTDVDIDNPSEVNWAISARARLSRDLLLVEGAWGFVMDPSRRSNDEPVTKLGIDATYDMAEKERFLKSDVKDYEKVDLGRYL